MLTSGMRVDQIEEQISHLTPADLRRLAEWFGEFLADRLKSPNTDWQESPEQIAELDKRLAEFEADPALAIPFEADFFDNLRQSLADERAKKASLVNSDIEYVARYYEFLT